LEPEDPSRKRRLSASRDRFIELLIAFVLKTICVIGPLSQSKTMAKKSLYNAL